MNGAGNDFVVLDNRFYAFSEADLALLARDLCRRVERVGADGLLALDHGHGGADFRMHYHNADGSRAAMCGNGARCLVRFAEHAGIAASGTARTGVLAFDTDAGRYHAVALSPGEVRLSVPPPERLHRVGLVGGLAAAFVWTGTEHVVVFVSSAARAPVASLGPLLRSDPALGAAGANVNFVEVAGPDRLRVRTFEKGVEAETRACGTGALAAALVALDAGRVSGRSVSVEMPGGTLVVEVPGVDGDAARPGDALAGIGLSGYTLTGPAETTFRGTAELDPAMLS